MQDLGVPGAVVMLRTPQGEVVASYGTTELGTDDRPDAGTHFRIASITKTMTSAVILQLVQEGKFAARRPGDEVHPRRPRRRRDHDRPAARDAQRAVQLHRRPCDLAGHGRRPDQGVHPTGAARHRVRPTADVRARLRLLLQQHQLRAARPDHRAVGRSAAGCVVRGPAVRAPRHEGHRHARPPTRTPSRRRSRTATCTAAPPTSCWAPRSTPRRRRRRPKAGTLQPNDFTDINHSFSFAAGAVTSTAADLATWFNGPRQRQGARRRAPAPLAGQRQDHRPQELLQLVRLRHRPAASGVPTRSTSTAARPPGSTRRRRTTPPTT